MAIMNGGRPNRRGPVGDGGALFFFGVSGLVLLAMLATVIAWAAAELAGHGHGGPVPWVLGRGAGERWSGMATLWAIVLGVVAAAFVGAVVRSIVRGFSGRQWTDSLAGSMSSRRDLAELSEESVAADTRRLGSERAGVGIRLGRAILTSQWLLSTYEWCQVWIMGPRAGKTRSVAVPQLVEHRGCAVATSNKPDIVYYTRGPRSELGRCWIQDPQRIYGEGPTWWWNPLTFVTSLGRAEQLAGIWLASRSDEEAAAADPYFEPMGRELLADLLLAAAVGGEPVTRVLEWVQFPDGEPGLSDPQDILRAHGFVQCAASIRSKRDAAPDERSGIYGTARSAVGFLRNPEYLPWIGPVGEGDQRPEFRAAEFVRTTQTLYLLSKEGAGSARAITGALTAAVYAAGEEWAERNGGRVPVPVLFCLDEAANVCRWPELPRLYSHAGSKGLILVTILQSKRQGETAWGVQGFGMLWSFANIAVTGGGLRDGEHLSDLAKLIGDRQVRDGSVTVSTGGHRSTSTQNREERIFTEADLAAMPSGRAVLFAAGSRSILLGLVDLSEREDAERISASQEAFQTRVEEASDAA